MYINRSQNLIDNTTPSSDKVENLQKLQTVVNASSRVLIRVKNIFPFDLFPNEIIVHETKVDIIYGMFFLSKKVISIPIENILNVKTTNSFIFGSLEFEVNGFTGDPQPVHYLLVRDAMKVRRIISGLILCHKEAVDFKDLDIQIVRKKLEEIGKT